MINFKATDKWYNDAAEIETGCDVSAGINTWPVPTSNCIYCKKEFTTPHDRSPWCSIGCELNQKYPDEESQSE